MAFRPLLRQRAVVPATSAILAAGLSLYPLRNVRAEAPQKSESPFERDLRNKPIYDDFVSVPAEPVSPPKAAPKPSAPTYTDRLAAEVAKARLFLHGYAAKTEDKVNDGLTEALRLENSFTSTIASLAPPKESGEKVMPGAIYVLVSAMAGSIVTRNRNILLRSTVPVAVGIVASYAILPLTTRNVGDLIWTYEERYPVIAENHLRAKERVTRFVQTGIAHSKMSAAMLEEKIGEAREAIEDWVKKGK
ncbi:Apolipoprotein O [Botryosphaeria dothidea]|uniref:MICOS complex subunit n=1 Tax=Botryosphaeria dothidea TaxID=55169 RepID=A0A8H4IH04_9PEZI|nr:Apolipoprotein O [Botryosphaeria dothidea]